MSPLDMTLVHLRFLDARNGQQLDTTVCLLLDVGIDAACG